MDKVINELEAENRQLIDRMLILEAENERVNHDNTAIAKALEKQKSLHRKFSEDVCESERKRNEYFASQKRSLSDENKALVKANRQLDKDVSFYKNAFEELSQKDKSVHIDHPSQKPNVDDVMEETTPIPAVLTKSRTLRTKSILPSSACSREVSKTSEKLFTENKKLQLKNKAQSATILLLKKKNQSLENFNVKMDNKKLKSATECEELKMLIDSTKVKNKDIFTTEILTKLGQFSQ